MSASNRHDRVSSIYMGKGKWRREPSSLFTTYKGFSDDVVTVCPSCGSSEVHLYNGELVCDYCKNVFPSAKARGSKLIKNLDSKVISSRSRDIDSSFDGLVTVRCKNCGSEVVINTNDNLQARCHWCREVLSVKDTIPNGVVPDMVLPFSMSREEAEEVIGKYVRRRSFFAKRRFRKEFSSNNILGVYLPYFVVDASSYADFSGVGSKVVSKRRIGDKQKKTEYTVDDYRFSRKFNLYVKGLTVESKPRNQKFSTGNILTSLMPFDTENAVDFNPNYLIGYSSEKREFDIGNIKSLVSSQIIGIGKEACGGTFQKYDFDLVWNKASLDIKGSAWSSIYCPVWLYSYLDGKVTRYVSVNARTGEVCGSIPLNWVLLLVFSIAVSFGIAWLLSFLFDEFPIVLVFIIATGVYGYVRREYLRDDARHFYESETLYGYDSMDMSDNYKGRRKVVE